MKKFSKNFTNKLVSYACRHGKWDTKLLKREDSTQHFDFFAVANKGNCQTIVCFSDSAEHGIWASIEKDNDTIYRGFITTDAEVKTFKKMIRCLG